MRVPCVKWTSARYGHKRYVKAILAEQAADRGFLRLLESAAIARWGKFDIAGAIQIGGVLALEAKRGQDDPHDQFADHRDVRPEAFVVMLASVHDAIACINGVAQTRLADTFERHGPSLHQDIELSPK